MLQLSAIGVVVAACFGSFLVDELWPLGIPLGLLVLAAVFAAVHRAFRPWFPLVVYLVVVLGPAPWVWAATARNPELFEIVAFAMVAWAFPWTLLAFYLPTLLIFLTPAGFIANVVLLVRAARSEQLASRTIHVVA